MEQSRKKEREKKKLENKKKKNKKKRKKKTKNTKQKKQTTKKTKKKTNSVFCALDDAQPQSSNPLELLQKLHADTGTEIPPRMLALENLPVLHSEVIPADKMELAVVKNLV